jgi:heme oxygenase
MKFSIVILLGASFPANGFVQPSSLFSRTHQSIARHAFASRSTNFALRMSSFIETAQADRTSESEFPPILMELRDVAMKLHTKEQAPREGQAAAPAKPAVPFVPTQADYLKFLIDSYDVYQTLEEIVDREELTEELGRFRDSGLERTAALEKDISWMCEKYNLEKPEVGATGKSYSEVLRNMITVDENGETKGVPEFICHYYNFYFAHLAGGRMIGKQMSKMLLDGETLEFYKVSYI